MEDSLTVHLDKLHQFLNQPQNAALWEDKRFAMSAIGFVKTVAFYCNADWSTVGSDGGVHFAELSLRTIRYFMWLKRQIIEVVECRPCSNLYSAEISLSETLTTIRMFSVHVKEFYEELLKVPHPLLYVDHVVFDEFTHSVEEYFVEVNCKIGVQMLLRFRHLVRHLSNQCTYGREKLQSLLARVAAVVLHILLMAYRNETEMENSGRFPASSDLSPEVSSAAVEVLKALKRPVHSVVEQWFLEFLQSVQVQASILGEILDLPILDLVVNEQVDYLLKEGYAVVIREVGSIPNHVALSNLLLRLSVIKAELFARELLNNKVSLTFSGEKRVAAIKKDFKFLNEFFKMQFVYMEDGEKTIIPVIAALLREAAGSLWDSCQTEQVSGGKILESSVAIFQLFKAEAVLMVVIHNTDSLKFLREFCIDTIHKSLVFMKELLLGPTKVSTISETLASKVTSFVCSIGFSITVNEPMKIEPLPSQLSRNISLNFDEVVVVYKNGLWSLLNHFPKSDDFVFAENLLGNLRKLLISNTADSIDFMRGQVEALLGELESLICYLKAIEKGDSKKKDHKLRVIYLIYVVEYIFDRLILRDVSIWYNHLVLYVTFEEIKSIKSRILDHSCDEEGFKSLLQDDRLTVACRTSEASNLLTEEVIVGFDDQAKIIEDQLRTRPKELQVVALVGMPGIGKTTLAQKLYSSDTIQYHFAVRARCSVSQVYRKRQVLLELLGDFLNVIGDTEKMDDNDLALKVRQMLSGKRYLIVVDDVWSLEHWNDLKLCFPDGNKGSRILFTTRDRNVARKAGPKREMYELRLLTPQQSWDLLQQRLFPVGKCPKQLLKTGKRIAERCRGLPLAIVVIAGILKKVPMKKDHWDELAKHLRSKIANAQEFQFLDILEFIYHSLPSYLKPCYLYLGAFLEDQEIPVKKLLRLWIAEGFIPKMDSRSLEETAEGYLVELMNRSLVMEAKRSSLRGTKTCRVHDMLCDLCLKKAKEENFMQLISMNGSQHSDSSVGKKYRLCVHSPKKNFIQLRPSASHVHSLLFFATNITHNNGSYDISSIVQDSQLLRVLDLESIRTSTFPRGIDLLVCLNYLALKGNITSVPPSIARLWNLETLIVKGTWGEIVLPSTIWSMTSLRHVHIRPRASLTLSSPELENAIELENLTTFSSPTFYYWIEDRMIVKRWTRLKKLRCIFWVLQELWDRDCRRYIIPTMEFLTQLESLNVSYIGKNFPCKLGFPLNLKKLTLSKFCFTWDYMAVIVRLSKLEVLKLLFNTFVGDTWYMTEETTFPKLKVLKLENLKLEKWNNSLDCSEHFPELERLVLRSCRKLAEVPSSFGEVLTLQTIEVQWCTKSAANSVKTILEQQKEWENQDFQATITPSEWDFRNSACL